MGKHKLQLLGSWYPVERTSDLRGYRGWYFLTTISGRDKYEKFCVGDPSSTRNKVKICKVKFLLSQCYKFELDINSLKSYQDYYVIIIGFVLDHHILISYHTFDAHFIFLKKCVLDLHKLKIRLYYNM